MAIAKGDASAVKRLLNTCRFRVDLVLSTRMRSDRLGTYDSTSVEPGTPTESVRSTAKFRAYGVALLCALLGLCGMIVSCVQPRSSQPAEDGRPDAGATLDLDPSFDPLCQGMRCETDSQCLQGERCIGNACMPDRGSCTSSGGDGQCADDSRCYQGACVRFDACAALEPFDPDCRSANFKAKEFPPLSVLCRYRDVNAFSTPLVADLDGDGHPEIITIAFQNQIVAVRGDTCALLWKKELPLQSDGQGSLAIADLDADGSPEIVGVSADARVFVLDHRGQLLAMAPKPLQETNPYFWEVWSSPSIADIDGTAPPEIIAGAQVLRFHKGSPSRLEVLWTHPNRTAFFGSLSIAADLDGDGVAEVVTSDRIYDGKTGADKTPPELSQKPFYAQVADFNRDGNPDLLLVQSARNDQIVSVYDYRARRLLFGPYRLAEGAWGGPAVIADFDGDGEVDFGLAAGRWYFAYALKCGRSAAPAGCRGPGPGLLWRKAVQDPQSGSGGSSAFDFNGDGIPEIVYRDECWLRIFRGRDGQTLAAHSITSSTGMEVPVVADVDGDGHADIVVTSDEDNDHLAVCANGGHPEAETQTPWAGWSRGVVVLHDSLKKSLPARPLWNQHAYHITNIADDLTVPSPAPASWLAHNTYRQNAAPGAPLPKLLTDLTARLLPTKFPRDCASAWPLVGQVCNRGTAAAPAPAYATFYQGLPDAGGMQICTTRTTTVLQPGDCETVGCDWAPPPTQKVDLYLRAGDDGKGGRAQGQCSMGNDVSSVQTLSCFGPPA